MILFGLYQLGVFGNSALLCREKRLPLRLDKMAMSPLTAFLMGFVFSFFWTPCIGPTLSSVAVSLYYTVHIYSISALVTAGTTWYRLCLLTRSA